ncbi:MAG TPA: DUF4197 domain-containing protein [Candidatus Tectomicrobia bacterium]
MSTLTGILVLTVGVVSGTLAAAQKPMERALHMPQGTSQIVAADLSDTQVANGLKEALRTGTDHAVARTGKTDGYFGNPLIKILLPENLQTLEKGVRLVGYGAQVDECILSMNRAAEKAAPEARRIFLDAITSMSFEDARKLLNGGDTAATDFFKRKTSGRLYDAFRPIVDNSMNQVGTVQKYNDMLAGVQKVPLVKKETLDVGNYVTNKALDGLFLIVAEEERSIRKNPAARVTTLLKEVFSR